MNTPLRSPGTVITAALPVLAALLAMVPSGRAASNFWNATASGNWSDAANWTGGVSIPGAASGTTIDNTALFNTAPGVTVTVDANWNLKNFSFDTHAGSFTFAGGPFVLTAGGLMEMTAGLLGPGVQETFTAPLSLAGSSYNIANNNGLSSNVYSIGSITNTTGSNLTLSGNNTGANTVGGVISNGTGTTSLVKSGGGTWLLTGANTYTGTTTLTGGLLRISGANGALNSTGLLQIGGDSTLVLDNTTAAGGNHNNRLNDAQPVQINGDFIYKGADAASTNSSETVGAVTFRNNSPTLTIAYGGTNSATLTATSVVSQGGAPTVMLSGVNLGKDSASTSGIARFIVTSAPTAVGTTNALATGINPAAKNTKIVPGIVGESDVATGGNGTATGVANTFIAYHATTGFRPLNPTDEFTNNAIHTGDNTYITQATAAAATDAINSLVLNGGNLTLGTGATLTNTSGMLLFASSNTLGGPGVYGAAGSTVNRFTVNSGVSAEIGATLAGTGGINKSGQGALTLSADNSGFSGAIGIDSGTLNIGNNNALGSGLITLYGPEAAIAAAGAPRTIANDLAFTNDNTSVSGAGVIGGSMALTINGMVSYNNSATGTLVVDNTGLTTFAGGMATSASGNGRGITIAGGGDLVINGVSIAKVSPGTGGSLTYAGTGKLSLTGSSTYQGGTAVAGGTVELDFANLATPANLIPGSSTLSLAGGTLSLKGKTGAYATSQAFTGKVTLSSNTRSGIALDANGGTGTTLTLENNWSRGTGSVLNINLSAGATLASAPIASVTTQGTDDPILGYAVVTDAVGTGFATVQNNQVVRYAAADSLLAASNNNARNFQTSGDLAFTNGTHSVRSLTIDASGGNGSLDMTAGTTALTFPGGAPGAILMTGSHDYAINGGTLGSNGSEVILHQLGSGTLTISSQIAGASGGLTKNGSGTVRLTGNSGFIGQTTVDMGTLLVAGINANSTVLVNAGGTLGGSGTVNNVTVQSGGTLAPGDSGGTNFTLAALTLNDGATSRFSIAGAGAGQFTTLTATGVMVLGGSLNLDFTHLLADGTSIDLFLGTIGQGQFSSILATGSYSGTFAGGILNTGSQTLSFDESSGVLSVAAIPEPSSSILALLGASSGFWMLRKRRNARA